MVKLRDFWLQAKIIRTKVRNQVIQFAQVNAKLKPVIVFFIYIYKTEDSWTTKNINISLILYLSVSIMIKS